MVYEISELRKSKEKAGKPLPSDNMKQGDFELDIKVVNQKYKNRSILPKIRLKTVCHIFHKWRRAFQILFLLF